MGHRRPAALLRGLAIGAACLLAWTWCAGSQAWLLPQSEVRDLRTGSPLSGRRAVLGAGVAGLIASEAEPARASGGSTAGKYSTIPSAKRRFYGRVRQGLYQYLQMEPDINAGNLQAQSIDDFFGKNIIKVKGGQDVKNCGFDISGKECKTKEKRTSRWLDWKVASDLLASAFRNDASDINDYLPQVKIIRAMHKKVGKIQEAIDKNDVKEVKAQYAKTKIDLERYLKLVELEPLTSEDYTHEWDTRPQVWCQGTMCVS